MNLGYLSDPPPGAHALSSPWTVWAACAACWIAFLTLHITGADLPPRQKLKRRDEIEWHSRLISSAHAIILCIGALLCYLELREAPRQQLVSGYAVWPDIFARIFLGYLFYDTSNMLVYFQYLGDTTAIIHHLLFMAAAAYVLVHSIMAFPFIWLALGEISTPAVNLRWHLAVTDKKEGTLYLANGLALCALFFGARVICFGAGLWHLWCLRDVWASPSEPPYNPALFALFCLGYALNLYWMQAILKGALRALSRGSEAGKKA